ncbi:MAG: GntR family transcriptional regulator [Thermodesulfobacteriota bacterium]
MSDEELIKSPESSKALYKVLADQLQDYIRNGYWQVGHIIPSENHICEQFSASRSTVKKTLEYLTRKGYLERRAGKGTWVVDYYLTEETWVVNGISPPYPYPDLIRAEIFSHETMVNDRSNPILAAFESEKVVSRVKLTRWLEQTPLTLVHSYMKPADAEIVLSHFNPQTDIYLYRILERATGRTVSYVKESYEAILAVGEIADRLEIASGSPLMLQNRLAIDEQGRLVLGASVYMRTDIQKMELSRKRTITSRKVDQ